jgi:hypothetical protein
MKIFFALLLLFVAGPLMAAPFLVCDPYPATMTVSYFTVTIDGGTPVQSVPLVNTDGTSQLHFDLTVVPAGSHTVTIKAGNVWGESASSAPFAFTKPASVLQTPGNINLVAK